MINKPTIIQVPSPIGGDCIKCWEPLVLEVNIDTKEEEFVCTNEICKKRYKFKQKYYKCYG